MAGLEQASNRTSLNLVADETDRVASMVVKEILSYGDVTEWKGSFMGEDGESSSILTTHQGDRKSLLVPPFYAGARKCNYCLRLMIAVVEPTEYHDLGDTDAFVMVDTSRYSCPDCGWWYVTRTRERREDGLEAGFHRNLTQFEGILRRWDLGAADVPISLLRGHLAKEPDYGAIDPLRFEKLVQAVFKDFYDVEVRHVGGTGDEGVDLIAVFGDKSFLIQVKRRGNLSCREGVEVVREVVGAVAGSEFEHAYLVTSAEGFTVAAMEYVERLSLKRRHISLRLMALPEFAQMLKLTSASVSPIWLSV